MGRLPAINTGINILPGLQAGMRMKESDARLQNLKMEQSLIPQREKRMQEAHDINKKKAFANTYTSILNAQTPEAAKILADIHGVKDFQWVGPDVSFTTPTGETVSGNAASVREVVNMMSGGGNLEEAAIFAMQNGVSIRPPEPPDTPKTLEAAMVGQNINSPDKLQALWDAKHAKSKTRLSVGPGGGIDFLQGPGVENIQLSKPQQNKVQEKGINAIEGLKRMEGIVNSFRPEFLEIPKRLGAEWTAVKEKLNMGDVKPEDQEFLEEYSVFKQDALDNINRYIKEITGAQMSKSEADRLRKAIPDPGEGIFDGDSPTQFRSKLINGYKKMKAAHARYNYYLNKGIPATTVDEMVNSGTVVSLKDMERIVEERANQIEKENPNATFKDVVDQVAKEFGL